MKAFVIGNVALDETVAIDDFPRAGASIFGAQLSRDLGGKGANQAIAMARTGLDCQLVAAIGRDARGEDIAARLAVEALPADLILLDGVATDFSMILMASIGENAVITTREAAAALTPQQARLALTPAQPGDLLAMQGNLSIETTRAALMAAREAGLMSALNPSPLQPVFATLWPLVDTAFVNEGEAEALGGVDALLMAGAGQVVLTLGGRGAALIRRGETVQVPARTAQVVDTTGAGDCFMAVALASAGLRGVGLDARALAHGAAAAAHTVARAGTVAAFPDRAGMAAILSA
ncbi:ribokinase [Paracoccus sp. M683]|uniref:PfkB family carbohydrate kinase n=1 Tax=Paracoccus sp. M683 TaxID=2594268 RepID=UPI00117FD84D|nr:PfkB family carbohydrate kinase [Paracoccus sp. M683]TRW95312.1 ribokinase [Paracoccus sp. M683]